MLKPVLLLLFLICSITVAQRSHPTATEQAHRQWLEERYKEATSITAGMTYADLDKLFIMDGGLQPMLPERFVLKSCDMIKVDVQFDVPKGVRPIILPEGLRQVAVGGAHPTDESDFRYVPDGQLKIKSISRPHLEHMSLD
ncbi:MAG: hypothetical protein ACJ74W_04490 [Pyrinomonadaceae bacterium]